MGIECMVVLNPYTLVALLSSLECGHHPTHMQPQSHTARQLLIRNHTLSSETNS